MCKFFSFLLLLSLPASATAPWSLENSSKIETLTQELERVGFTPMQIAAVVKSIYMPVIDVVIRKAQENVTWLSEMGVKNVGALVEKFPAVLSYSISENLEPKAAWLTQVGVKNVGALIERYPSVLSHNICDNLELKVDWLVHAGVKNPGVFIEKLPQVLGMSVELNLKPKVEWLKEQGVKNPGVLIGKFPSVLGYNIEKNLDRKLAWFKERGVQNPGSLIARVPSVLGMSIENLNLKVAFLRQQGAQNPGALIEKFPQVLSFNLDGNLKPTFYSLRSDWSLEVRFIEAHPILLGASLKRMHEVLAVLDHLGVDVKRHLTQPQKAKIIQGCKVSELVANLRTLGLIKPEVKSILEVTKGDLPCRAVLLETLPKWLKKAPAAGQCDQLIESCF